MVIVQCCVTMDKSKKKRADIKSGKCTLFVANCHPLLLIRIQHIKTYDFGRFDHVRLINFLDIGGTSELYIFVLCVCVCVFGVFLSASFYIFGAR